MELPVVGITGKMRHGKGLFGELLAQRLKHPFRAAFATPLKELVLRGLMLPVIKEDYIIRDENIKRSKAPVISYQVTHLLIVLTKFLENHNLPPLTQDEEAAIYARANEPTSEVYRWALQYIGTEVVRARDEDFWTNYLWTQLEPDVSLHRTIIIDDLRFPNEAASIRRHGGIIVKVIRKSFKPLDNTHPSETMVDKIEPDYTFLIDEGIENVAKAVDKFLNQLKEKGYD